MTEKYNDYIALNGEELLEVILRKGRKLLAPYNQYFGKHLAYHNPFIRLAVKVECFTPEGTPDAGGFELSLSVTPGPIYEPDKMREEIGIGTYQTQLVDEYSGTLADVRVNVGKSELLGASMQKDIEATLKKVGDLLGEQKEEPIVDEATEEKRRKWREKGKRRREALKARKEKRELKKERSDKAKRVAV